MIKNIKFKEHGVVIVFIIIVIFSSIVTKGFLSKININNILRQGSILGLLAIGQSLVIFTGGIDLSVGSVVALSSILYATFMPQSILLAVLITLFICTFVGLLNGFIISRIKIIPFIVTLGMTLIARGLAQFISKGQIIYGINETFAYFIMYKSLMGIPIAFIILIIMYLIVSFFINNNRFGRYIYAVGSNEETARLFGINVGNIKLLVYSLSGFFAGLAGLLYVSRVLAGYSDEAVGYEFNAITAAVIGGVSLFGGEGKLANALLGGLIITIISNVMNLNSVSPFLQGEIKGLLIILSVYISIRRIKK